jgi:hypothetical protein
MPPVSVAHRDGDRLTATLTKNNFNQWSTDRRRVTGLHVYLVNEPPDAVGLPSGIASYDSTRYWGVYPAMPYDPGDNLADSYDFRVVYHYAGNPTINQDIENTLRLLNRRANHLTNWANDPVILADSTAKTLTIGPRQVRDEYLAGGTRRETLQPDRNPPAQPVVAGPLVVCAGATGLKFYVNKNPRATAYVWELPPGLTGFSETDTIVASAQAGAGGRVRVWAVNQYGRSQPAEWGPVVIRPSPAGSVDFLQGPFSVCQGAAAVPYSIPAVAGATAYRWQVPPGAVVAAGQGTASASVTFGSTSGKVSVWAVVPDCGSAPILINERSVLVNRQPDLGLALEGNRFCLSSLDSGRVTIRRSEFGVVYQAYLGSMGNLVGPMLAGNGQDLVLALPRSLLSVGSHQVGVAATAQGCAPTSLAQTATITVLPALRTDLEVVGQPVCGQNNTFITIRNSQVGVTYTASIYYFYPWGDFDLFSASQAVVGNGGDLQLPIMGGWYLTTGRTHRFVVFADQAGCTNDRLRQEATITVYDPLNGNLAVRGSQACNGGDAVVQLPQTQVGVSYQAFIGSNPVGLPVTSALGGPVQLVVPGNLLPNNATTTVRVRAAMPPGLCVPNPIFLTQSASIVTGNFVPELALAVDGSTVCPRDSAQVTVRNTQLGVYYTPTLGGNPVGRRALGTGGDLRLRLSPNLLAEGNNLVRVQAQGVGCTNIEVLNNTATVTVRHRPRILAIRGQTTVCSGTPLALFTDVSLSRPQDNAGFQNWLQVSIANMQGTVNGLQLGKRGSCCGNPASGPSFTETLTGNGIVQLWLVARNDITDCDGDSTLLTLRVVGPPQQPAPFLRAPASVCRGETDVVYAVPFEPNVAYAWTYSGMGVTLTPIGAGDSVRVSFGPAATAGALRVTASNNCGPVSPAREVAIQINDHTLDLGLAVTGSEACEGTVATVTVANAQPGVTYQAFRGWVPVGPPAQGNGGQLLLTVLPAGMSLGPNQLTVRAAGGGCSGLALTNQATVVYTNSGGQTLTWTGLVDDDWHKPGNWSCGVIPGPNTVVLVPGNPVGAAMPRIYQADAFCFSLSVANGASLTMVGNRQLSMGGDLANAGIFMPGSGTVRLVGTAVQQLSGPLPFHILVVDNPAGAACPDNQPKSVAQALRFVRGKLAIGDSDWTVSGLIEGHGANAYLVTNGLVGGGGFLHRPVASQVGEVIFPVGLAGSYTPAGLANTGQTADFRVRVFPNVHEFGLSGAVRNQSTVQRTWEIEPLGPQAGAVDVALRLQWNAADEHLEFYTIRAYMAKHRGQPGQRWERLNSQPTAGNGPFAVVASGIREFSKFTVASGLDLLPVRWLYFTASAQGADARLDWATASEQNNRGFVVEKSHHGLHFDSIGFVPGRDYSDRQRDYTFLDKNFVDNAYYRLRQVDADYQFELSRVVFLAKEGGNLAGFRLDPNPVDDQQALRLQSSAPPPGEVRVQLFNSVGQLLGEARGSLPQLNEWLNARKTGLATGAYFLRVGTGTAAQILPWVKQ